MSTVALLGAVELGLIYGLRGARGLPLLPGPELPRPHGRRQLPAGGRRGGRPRSRVASIRLAGDRARRGRRCRGRAGDGDPQRALQDPAPARQHPDHDRPLLDQPADHGPAEHRAAQRDHGADAVRGAGPAGRLWLRPLVLLVAGGRCARPCWSRFLLERGRARDAGHRRQPAHGRGAGHPRRRA